MDEGIKRKLVGAVVLVTAALIILPNITSKTRNAEHLGRSVAIETHIPSMEMPLPKALPITVSKVMPENTPKGEFVAMQDIEVDGQTLALKGFEVPVTTPSGQAVTWQIQVASFAKIKNALKLRNKLRKAGYKAFEKLSPDAKFTRVFVGPSTQKMQLLDELKAIKKDYKLTPKLTIFTGK